MRKERSYKEFAQDILRRAKNRDTSKEKGKGMKYWGAPKGENVKYPTNPSNYTEDGARGKRTPDNQSRGEVKRRRAMAVLVTEALERSDDMFY